MIKSNSANTFKALSAVALIIAGSVAFSGQSGAETKQVENQLETSIQVAATTFEMPAAPAIAIEGSELLAKRAAKLYQPSVTATAHTVSSNQISSPWQRLSSTPSLAISDAIESKDAISIDVSAVINTQVGDEIEVILPGDLQYLVVVDSKQAGSWSGYVEGFEQQYPVIFTASKTSVFATITTPEGSFTLEAIDGEGWVYQNPEMSDLNDHNSEDFMLPSGHHNHADV